MKYIDAEKLIAEIERYKQGAAITRFDNAGENADYFQGKVDLCDDLTHIIDSLQHEQPDFPTTDEEVEKALSTIPKAELPDKYKTPDWLFEKQEQPEVDLEKEIDKWFDSMGEAWEDGEWSTNDIKSTARHFFELGLNAIKEE